MVALPFSYCHYIQYQYQYQYHTHTYFYHLPPHVITIRYHPRGDATTCGLVPGPNGGVASVESVKDTICLAPNWVYCINAPCEQEVVTQANGITYGGKPFVKCSCWEVSTFLLCKTHMHDIVCNPKTFNISPSHPTLSNV